MPAARISGVPFATGWCCRWDSLRMGVGEKAPASGALSEIMARGSRLEPLLPKK